MGLPSSSSSSAASLGYGSALRSDGKEVAAAEALGVTTSSGRASVGSGETERQLPQVAAGDDGGGGFDDGEGGDGERDPKPPQACASYRADLLIANPPSFAAPHIAERLGVPLHMAVSSAPAAAPPACRHPHACSSHAHTRARFCPRARGRVETGIPRAARPACQNSAQDGHNCICAPPRARARAARCAKRSP